MLHKEQSKILRVAVCASCSRRRRRCRRLPGRLFCKVKARYRSLIVWRSTGQLASLYPFCNWINSAFCVAESVLAILIIMSHMSGFQIPMVDEEMDGYSSPNDILLQGASSQGHSVYNIPAVGSRFQNAPLSEGEAKAAMQSILDIFELDEELPDRARGSEQDEDDSEPVPDPEDQSRRIDRLRKICPALDQLWWTNSDYMTVAAEKLADGCRDCKSASHLELLRII